MMRFVIYFITSLVATISTIIATNYFVDPLAQFSISGALFFSTDRQVKARLVEARKYDGLILGSSKVEAIQPQIVFPDQDVLNGGYGGARPEEMLKFLEHHSPDIKWLAIGFDLFTFNESYSVYLNDDDPSVSYSTPHYLLSIDTFIYSIATWFHRHTGGAIPQYTEHGALNPDLKVGQECDRAKCDYTRAMEMMRQNHFSEKFILSTRRLELLAQIVEWAKENEVYLVAWMNPRHRAVNNLIDAQVSRELLAVREALSRNFPIFLDLSERYSEDRHYMKTDPFHFQVKVANEMASRFIAPIVNKFIRESRRGTGKKDILHRLNQREFQE
jgi:hypothetical protein